MSNGPQLPNAGSSSPWQIDIPSHQVFYAPLALTFSMVLDPKRFSADVIGIGDIRAVPVPSRSACALPEAEIEKVGREARYRYVTMLWTELQRRQRSW